jgi:hypothetical protein
MCEKIRSMINSAKAITENNPRKPEQIIKQMRRSVIARPAHVLRELRTCILVFEDVAEELTTDAFKSDTYKKAHDIVRHLHASESRFNIA